VANNKRRSVPGSATSHKGSPDKTAILEGDWKLIVLGGPATRVPLKAVDELNELPEGLIVELYDLGRDPGEESNIAVENPKVVAKLLKQLHEFRSLKLDGVPDFRDGVKGFVAPKEWKIED
jgi:hypothetical protein